jgi:hypothetical protein
MKAGKLPVEPEQPRHQNPPIKVYTGSSMERVIAPTGRYRCVIMSACAKPFNPKQEFEHERLKNASLFADSGRPPHQPAGATVVPGICFDADGHPLTLLICILLPLGDHNTATEQDSDCLLWVEKGGSRNNFSITY